MNPECEEQVRLETVRERIMVTNSASELGKSFSHSSYLLPNKIVICFAVRIRCAPVILSELFDPVHLVLFKSEDIIRLICKFKHAYHTSEHLQLRRKINPNIFDKNTSTAGRRMTVVAISVYMVLMMLLSSGHRLRFGDVIL